MNACTRWFVRLGLLVPIISASAHTSDAQEVTPKPNTVKLTTSDGVVWTGRIKAEDGSLHEEPLRSARELRKDLATIQVSIDVDRKFEPALAKLDDLQVRASRGGYPERQDVLVEIALARASVLESLGRMEQANSAASCVLPVSLATDSRYQFDAGSYADHLMANTAAADPRLVAFRARFAQSAAKPADGEDKVEDIVNDAVLNNRQASIKDLGDRALPALEKLAAHDLDSLPSIGSDPLFIIADLNQARAAEFMRANFDRGASIWKARMLRVLKQIGPFKWKSVGNGLELENPVWLPIVERLLDEPTTVREALALVGKLTQFDAVTVGMQQRAIKILNGENSAVAASAMAALSERGRPNSKLIFEAVLASPNGEVRAFAARQLAQYETSDALLSSYSSPDASVRAQVAVALGGRECSRFVPNGQIQLYRFDPPSLSSGQREILTRLIADPIAEVRVAAANSIVGLSIPLDDTVYERIGKDSDSRVRATLLKANAVPVPVQAKIALALASDTDLGVLRSFDSFAALLSMSKEPLDPAYLPAIEARLRNPALPFQLADSNNQSDFYLRIRKSPEGLTALVHWALEIRSSLAYYAVASIKDRIGSRSSTPNQPWPRGTVKAAAVGVRLAPQELAAFFELVSALPGDLSERDLVPSLILLSDDLAPVFLPIARDAKQDRQIRLQALDIAARGQPEQVSDCMLELMADPGWQSSNVKPLSHHAGSIGNGMQPQGAERTFDRLFDGKKSLDPILASSFANGLAMARPFDARAADRVLAAWYDNREVGNGVLEAALKQVASRPREAQGDWLLRAVRDNRFCFSVLVWMGDMRDPSYLAVLEEGLSKGFIAGNPESQRAALNALTRYFSEPAAEIILKVAGSTANSALREECFKALDTIRQYKEEKGRWDDDRVSKEATAAAVRDLVGLLDDASAVVRAQAVRGLGTLHAVEQMPRIVRMLKDADAEVRKAADDALRVLNATPAKKE